MKRAIASTLFVCVVVSLAVPGVAGADTVLTQAIAALALRLEETPRDASLLTDYANLLTRAGRYDEARSSYRTALENEPQALLTLYNLGLLELELGHLRAAGRHLRQAIDVDRDFARGHYALGTVLVARQRHPRAVRHFARALTLDPDLVLVDSNPEIVFNRLATWAAVRSYLSESTQRGTRLYNDPQPIVGLLVPDLELLAPPAEPDPTVEDSTVPEQASAQSDDG